MLRPVAPQKIVNDPVYGFISLPAGLIFELVDHPWLQRLRRIKQVGLTHLVYPGALHTRFHHALGAMHLMQKALYSIESKGNELSPEEKEAALLAILMHDAGHGPFSHALEFSLVRGLTHEDLSALFMERLNEQFGNRLQLAIDVFQDRYPRRFLHQLVSGQLDMDRLDYLARDTFYTGVSEGTVSNERIISMLQVVDDRLVVEEKGVYSLEKFLIARRLMYWQVYLHKTVLAAEYLLVNILQRAKHLAQKGVQLWGSPALQFFLYETIDKNDFHTNPKILETFARLDDYDIMGAIKVWQDHPDFVLADLCSRMVNRRLFKLELRNEPVDPDEIDALVVRCMEAMNLTREDARYFVYSNSIENKAYSAQDDQIIILRKNGQCQELSAFSDNVGLRAQDQPVRKWFLSYPKRLGQTGAATTGNV